MNGVFRNFFRIQEDIKHIGYTPGMDGYEKRKLGIFNLVNFSGLVTGLVVPLAGLFNNDHLPTLAWLIACSPALIGAIVLTGNYYRKYEAARMCYFTLYPLLTTLVYAIKIDVGIEFFFVLYGVLSVFFLKKIYNVIFSFTLSMACYFVVTTIWTHYDFRLELTNYPFWIFNHILAIFFIFFALYLIKTENGRYQLHILNKNRQLNLSYSKIQRQKEDIGEKARLLEGQTIQLTELNSLKNKLFSVIAHDLKTPMYALRNLFRNIQQYDVPGDEIKTMIPEVVDELSYTTGLMENLLQWAKSQMQAEAIKPQVLDIGKMTKDVLQLLRLQAETKHIHVTSKISRPVYVYADKDMIDLVLRNLLSNAIKFTPQEGSISVGAMEDQSHIEIYVKDSGTGISPDNIKKLMDASYYTTKGTANESGTGLGLMLCREFLSKNGGEMHVHSEQGKGSIFSFTLPKAEDEKAAAL